MIDVYINKIYLEIILTTATGLPKMNKMCPKREPFTPKVTKYQMPHQDTVTEKFKITDA